MGNIRSNQKEYESSWSDAFNLVEDKIVPRQNSIITSHVIYKIKTSEDGTHARKAIILLHRNRDSEKYNVRKDSSAAQFDVIRIILSVSSIFNFRFALPDVEGPYLQSGPIQREI